MADMKTPGRGDRRWLVIMAKEPRCGAVKTRLARDIGSVAATGFYRRTLANVSLRVANDPRWRTLIAVTPDSAVFSPIWTRGCAPIPQRGGDLGARMQRLFDRLPPGPAVIIGTDIPEITHERIAAAFRALGPNDAVLGPGDDGGYWLVGLRRTPKVPAIFSNIRWSSKDTLADTLANLQGMRVALLDPLADADDGRGYRRLAPAGSRLVLPARWKAEGG